MKWLFGATLCIAALLTLLRRRSADRDGLVYWTEPEDGIQYDIYPYSILQSREYSTFRG